jgi:hypothetical protein
MTRNEALKVLDFMDEQHAKLWLDNRMVGSRAIHLDGVFTTLELEAVVQLIRERE